LPSTEFIDCFPLVEPAPAKMPSKLHGESDSDSSEEIASAPKEQASAPTLAPAVSTASAVAKLRALHEKAIDVHQRQSKVIRASEAKTTIWDKSTPPTSSVSKAEVRQLGKK
jgi:hypothetical protein